MGAEAGGVGGCIYGISICLWHCRKRSVSPRARLWDAGLGAGHGIVESEEGDKREQPGHPVPDLAELLF